MELTYTNILIGLAILLFGVLGGFKLIPLILKRPLSENEIKIQTEIANYAKIILTELEKESGSEEELKQKAVDAISMEFGGKVDKKIISVVVDSLYELMKKNIG